MFTKTKFILILVIAGLLLAACAPAASPAATPTSSAPVELRVMTYDSFAASDAVIKEFETTNNARLVFIPSGDTGSALNQAILTKNNPLADVFYGIDNTFLSRGLEEDIFIPYASPLLDEIPDNFKLDLQNPGITGGLWRRLHQL